MKHTDIKVYYFIDKNGMLITQNNKYQMNQKNNDFNENCFEFLSNDAAKSSENRTV